MPANADSMRRRYALKRAARRHTTAWREVEDELALQVVVLYADLVTRRWTKELWSRVGHLTGSGGICRKVWRMSDLARDEAFAAAVRAATRAHVLVISFRDEGELPSRLCEWFEAWVPHRTACGGAMVALIGVQAHSGAEAGHAYSYLESVARRAGMDFLPHERRLPDQSSHAGQPEENMPAAGQVTTARAGYVVGAGI